MRIREHQLQGKLSVESVCASVSFHLQIYLLQPAFPSLFSSPCFRDAFPDWVEFTGAAFHARLAPAPPIRRGFSPSVPPSPSPSALPTASQHPLLTHFSAPSSPQPSSVPQERPPGAEAPLSHTQFQGLQQQPQTQNNLLGREYVSRKVCLNHIWMILSGSAPGALGSSCFFGPPHAGAIRIQHQ